MLLCRTAALTWVQWFSVEVLLTGPLERSKADMKVKLDQVLPTGPLERSKAEMKMKLELVRTWSGEVADQLLMAPWDPAVQPGSPGVAMSALLRWTRRHCHGLEMVGVASRMLMQGTGELSVPFF